jgi:preprotein translocase subunit YajC
MTNLILAAQAAPANGGGGVMTILFFVAMIAIMYFFMIRPQMKRQKEVQNFQNSLTEGMQVMTGGGLYGTVKKIDLQRGTIDVKIAHDVVVTVDKNYVFKDAASSPIQNK